MHAQPSIAPDLGWLRTLALAVAFVIAGVASLSWIADDEAETGCGGG